MHRLLRFSLLFFISVAVVCGQNDIDDDGDDDAAEPCACPAFLDPVCGRDGDTYDNRDCAGCAGVEIACSQPCPCNNIACTCLAEGPQVCGTDGVTYGNECLANCEGIAKICDGRCPCDDDDDDQGRVPREDIDDDDGGMDDGADDDDDDIVPDCVCTLEFDPVCGFNQDTYGNECAARCSGAEIACYEECPCRPNDCICPEISSPVCGVNGETYDNECIARCVGIPVDCNQGCGCPCDREIVNCDDDPCQNAQCPAYPDATCYSNSCGGCNTVFVFKGEIVDCDVSPPPTCVRRDEVCNVYVEQFADRFPDALPCCNDLECCPDRCFNENVDIDDDTEDDLDVELDDDDLDDDSGVVAVTSVFGTCRNSCNCSRRRSIL